MKSKSALDNCTGRDDIRTMLRALALVLAMLVAQPPDAARAEGADADVVLLVDRRADRISVYLQMPAPLLPTVFGSGAEPLLGADGTVDIDVLFNGTFPLADRIFGPVEARLDGQPAGLEAMSMMVHDPAVLPDFASPYDAELSIAVCTSPETVQGMTLEHLVAYMGFFAWKVDGFGALALDFPALGRDALRVRILEFAEFRALPPRDAVLEDGGRLELARIAPGADGNRVLAGAAAIAALALAVAALFLVVVRKRLVSSPVRE